VVQELTGGSHVCGLDRCILLHHVRRSRNGRNCERDSHSRWSILLGCNPSSPKALCFRSLDYWLVRTFYSAFYSKDTELIGMNQVQPTRSSRSNNWHFIRSRRSHLYHRNRQILLRTNSRQNSRHLRSGPRLPRHRQHLRCAYSALPEQHIYHLALSRRYSHRYCSPSQSPNTSKRQVRIRDLLRRNWRLS
jgi:hypothetical protein